MTPNTPHTTQNTTQDTHDPYTVSIEDLREAIAKHQKEACDLAAQGMFYSSKFEIEECIALATQIGKRLLRGD